MTTRQREPQPTVLESVLGAFVDGHTAGWRTAFVARVVAYDAEKQRVTVRPVGKDVTLGGDPVTPPVLSDVPVLFPRGGNFHCVWPLAVDDDVLIVCADRSIDEWMAGGAVDAVPADPRRYSLTDAVAIPGIGNNNSPLPTVAEEARFCFGNARVSVFNSGRVVVTNGLESLFPLLAELADLFNPSSGPFVEVGSGLVVPGKAAIFELLRQAFDKFENP